MSEQWFSFRNGHRNMRYPPTSTGLGNFGGILRGHGVPWYAGDSPIFGQTVPQLTWLWGKYLHVFFSASPSASLPEPLGGRVPFQYSRKRRDYAEVPTVVTSRWHLGVLTHIDPTENGFDWLCNAFQYFWMPFKSFHIIFIPSTSPSPWLRQIQAD